jgi:glycosyltransferase involved in cell wall biosynthesis
MAAGKPIIAILEKGTEVAYIIDEEKIGWIVEPENYQNLADIIIEAKKNRENTLLMGDRARKTAEKKYSFERVLHIFCKYLIGFESVNHE